MPIVIERTTLEQIYRSGLFDSPNGETNVPESAYCQYLAGLNSGSMTLWADNHFDASRPPDDHFGITICYGCFKVYWITPEEDAFGDDPAKGKKCIDCLAAGRKVIDVN